MEYNEHSIDSKITQLLVLYQSSESDRVNFRATILKDLETIKNNTRDLDHRLLTLQDKVDNYIEKQDRLNEEIYPLIDAYSKAEGGYLTLKNILLFISFVLGLVSTYVLLMDK